MEIIETVQIIPLVMILVGIIKDVVPKKYLAGLAVIIGVGLAIAFDANLASVVNGVMAGVASIGTYATAKGFKNKEEISLEEIENMVE